MSAAASHQWGQSGQPSLDWNSRGNGADLSAIQQKNSEGAPGSWDTYIDPGEAWELKIPIRTRHSEISNEPQSAYEEYDYDKAGSAANVNRIAAGERQNAWEVALGGVIASQEKQKETRSNPGIVSIRKASENGTQIGMDSAQFDTVSVQHAIGHSPTERHDEWSKLTMQETGTGNDNGYTAAPMDTNPGGNQPENTQNTRDTADTTASAQEPKNVKGFREIMPSHKVPEQTDEADNEIWDHAPFSTEKGSAEDPWDKIPVNAAVVAAGDQKTWDITPTNTLSQEVGGQDIWDHFPSSKTVKSSSANQYERSGLVTGSASQKQGGDLAPPSIEGFERDGSAQIENTSRATRHGNGPYQNRTVPRDRYNDQSKHSGTEFTQHIGDRRGWFQEEYTRKASSDRRQLGSPNESNKLTAFGRGDARRYTNVGHDQGAVQTPKQESNQNYSVRIDMPRERERRPSNLGQNRGSSQAQSQNVSSSFSHVAKSPRPHGQTTPSNFMQNANSPQVEPEKPASLISNDTTRNIAPFSFDSTISSDLCSHDWMIVDNGHHYTCEISFFAPRTYLLPPPTPTPLTVASHPVAGVGTVHLSVRRFPSDREVHTLILKNVLHIPTAPCNGFDPGLLGHQCTEQAGVVQGTGSRGKRVWYADLWCGSPRLVLPDKRGEKGWSGLEGKGRWWMGSMYPTDNEVQSLEEWFGLLKA